MTPVENWNDLAEALRAELVATGKLTSRAWQEAFTSVPRHHFVPEFYQRRTGEPGWELVSASDGTADQRWLAMVYANVSLVTQIGEVPDGGRDLTGPTSSSSAPSLMARMLETLQVGDGHRVLEIGTGTGYNAALLSYHLGDENVFSLDVDPDLVNTARTRLATLGYHPTVIAADGAAGLPQHAPYDRIISTCALPRLPWAWAEQVRPGGLILVDVKVHAVAGNLVLLHRKDDRLEGRFVAGTATFMQIRSPNYHHGRAAPVIRDRRTATHRTTTLMAERPWENAPLWFLAHLQELGRLEFGYAMDPTTGGPGPVYFTSRDGSWCELATRSDGTRDVWEGGPRRIWANIEAASTLWHQFGKPDWDRFGLTVFSDDAQLVWIDNPDTRLRWELPV